MATCDAQSLLDDAATSGFTKLSHEDKFSVQCELFKEWSGNSDSAGTLLEAASDSGFTKLSYQDQALTVKAQLLCELT